MSDVDNIQSDQPIVKSSEDRFGRAQFAVRVANVIIGRSDPKSIVVSINGPWGEGKTSMLNMIVEEFDKHSDKVTYIRFNPWRFADETQLLNSFFSLLAEKLSASLQTRPEKASRAIQKYGEALAPITTAASVFTLNIDVAAALRKLASTKASVDLEEYKRRVDGYLQKATKRIVIIMDDIDRLDDLEIQAVFKLVKLSADFENTAYILAFDEEKVAAALAKKYANVQGGRSFLEKIIQVPLPLPPAGTKFLRELAFEGLQSALNLSGIELTDNESARFIDLFDKGFRERLVSPRLAKRFANALTFALPILKGEVDVVDLMLIEALRTFYPQLYEVLRSNEAIFAGTPLDALTERPKKREKEGGTLIGQALTDFPGRSKEGAKKVIEEVFPLGRYNSDWAENKRAVAGEYFARYFTYGIPPDDISDNELNSFLSDIGVLEVIIVVDRLRAFAGNNRSDVLIQKLRFYEDDLSLEASRKLATGIATGNFLRVSSPEDDSLGLGSYAEASSLIRHLLQRIPSQNRDAFSLDIARNIIPMPFATQYSRWIKPLKASQYSDEMVLI